MLSIEEQINRILKKFLPNIIKGIKIDFSIGSALTIQNAKLTGNKTTMSPLNMTKEQQKTNIEMIESLIKDVNSEVAKKINYVINKGITEKWDNKMVADELKKLNIEETYKGRFENIATTESFRIMNNGSFNTAKRLNYTHKYLYNLVDNRTGEDSLIAKDKYDGEENAIPIDEPFRYTYKGKERVFMFPPDRPRDRSLVYFTNKK